MSRSYRQESHLAALCTILPFTWSVLFAPSARGAGDPVVFAAGDLRGELRPCGCSPEGQMGGLPRRLTYLERHRDGAAVVVDLGNNFPDPSAQGRLKADVIQALLKRSGVRALLPGPNEIALGLDILDPALPYVVSNEAAERQPAGSGARRGPLADLRMIQAAGRRIAVLGYLSPALIYQGPQSPFRLLPAAESLLMRWRRLLAGERASLAVLLFRGDDAELATIAAARLFDAVVAGNPSSDETNQVTARQAGSVTVPQVPTKGQGVLRLRLGRTPSPARVDWLKEDLADDPAATSALAAYDERVKALFFQQAAQAASQREDSPYSGAAACRECHGPAYDVWRQARHARALASLQGVGKQFDPECLACHVAGLGRNGYISQEATPQLANVQCENCHGPGRQHGAEPARKPVPTRGATTVGRPSEATCRGCHQGSHSPAFSFPEYWAKIKH
jgi:hypothetical protein